MSLDNCVSSVKMWVVFIEVIDFSFDFRNLDLYVKK